MTTQTYNSALLATFLTALAFGCTQDQVGTYDVSTGEDMGPTDEVGTDADAADAADVGTDGDARADANPDADGGTMEDTSLGIEAPVVPGEPDQGTHCNEENWCWLHPAPFPHRITDLQRVGDRVFGVANARPIQGKQGVIWDGESLELQPKPVSPGVFLPDMTTTADGWLALKEDGTVLDVGPEGVRGSRQIPGDGHWWISGNSFDSFVVGGNDTQTRVVQGGRLLDVTLPNNISFDSVMMPSGDIWALTSTEGYSELLEGRWRIFPAPEVTEDYLTMGPSPDSPCSSEGIFLGSSDANLYRWDDFNGAFASPAYDGSGVTAIGCSPDGDLIVGDETGTLFRRTGEAVEPWDLRELFDRRIEDVEVEGSELHVSGKHGEHALVAGDEVTSMRSGFRVPSGELPDDPAYYFESVWVADSADEIILSHSSGTYRGTESGFSRMPIDHPDHTDVTVFEQMHRAHGDLYALSDSRFWRWTGSTWTNITQEALGESQFNTSGSMVGPDGDLWLMGFSDLFRYDGDTWMNLLEEGTPLEESLDGSELSVDNIFSSHDGDLVVSTDSATHTLSRDDGAWTLTKRLDVPCERPGGYYDAADGSVWVIGDRRQCVAGWADGEWTTYELPDEDNRPPTDFGPEKTSWLPQPGSDVPLLAHAYGILEPRPDGTLQPEFVGEITNATYVPSRNATVVLTPLGAIVKYYQSSN